MSDWYDMDGNVISMAEWSDRYGSPTEGGDDPRHVEQTQVGDLYVSTVLLGLDHSFMSDRPPVIFETMVFPCNTDGEITDWHEVDCRRYSTVEAAREGHWEMVERVKAGTVGYDA